MTGDLGGLILLSFQRFSSSFVWVAFIILSESFLSAFIFTVWVGSLLLFSMISIFHVALCNTLIKYI